jgi:3-hydroxyacyl-CoA dehydrogenase/enoyl-CoA hydratase/3-hydroxybutyryl-CoA epimerase
VKAFDLRVEDGGLASLTFDLPGEKINKFSADVLAELDQVVGRLEKESGVRGLLIASGKPDMFIAGVDLKEFPGISPSEAGPGAARVEALFERVARLPYPVVAAINGVCLGGGVELALACDYRVMSDAKKAQIGLPEVRLGVFPAWGGCTRLPRLVGLQSALDLILTGKSLDARRARKIGLVDEAVPAAIFEDWARQFARGKAGGGKPPRSVRKPRGLVERVLEATPLGRRLIFSKARKGVLSQTGGHYPAPLEALDVIAEGFGKPAADGFAAEARHIGNVFGGDVQRNLLAIFFMTEAVKKETGVRGSSVKARPVARVGVLGAGVMGGGIAQLAADKGLSARMKDIDAKALGHGYAAAAAVWEEQVRKRRLAPREMASKMALLSGSLDYSGFARCDVTIEAVVEKLAVKRAVLAEWEAAVPKTAIFASNTSTLPITEIAAGAQAPARVIGMHFFNPVHRMPLVEVIRGRETSDETVATVFAFARTLGKTPVVVRDAPGFLVNRILTPYLAEAVTLLEEGSRIEDVDGALTGFGMPVGPLALLDDVGLDVAAKASEVMRAAFPERMKLGAQNALPAAGRLGRKNGKGFYEYEGTKRRGPSQSVYALLKVAGAPKTPLPADVLQARCILPMVNEAAFCLQDRIVTDPGKLDLAMIFGIGFPPFRGGLLKYADSVGLDRIFARLDDLAERLGARFAPCDLIRDLANSGKTFASLASETVSTEKAS